MFRFLLLLTLTLVCATVFGAEIAPAPAKMSVFQWIAENYKTVLLSISALIGFAEIVTRLTPTEKDDGFIKRIGDRVDKILDFFKIPNNRITK